MPRTPFDGDSGDRAQRRFFVVFLATALSIISLAVGFLVVGGSPLLLLFPVLGIAVAFVIRELFWSFFDRSSRAIGRMVHSAGNIPYSPTYSAEDALVARGDHAAAAAAYRAHADANPAAVTPLLRLAELNRRHLRDDAEAERLYLEVRRRSADPGAAANQLIDLYRATGNRGRLMAELARYSALHADTAAGAAARKELQLLKDEAASA
ncbi:MAG TPA: hypothetical protein VFT04_11710 [Gemmatimonadales bacterium]|nr:hypothetical protein [Gemmatimonadales bacterium]